VVEEGKSTRIMIRPFESLSSWLLPAPYRLVLLAWSPDSRGIAFYSDGKLWRMDASGGSPLEIGEAQNVRSAAWGAGGQFVYANSGTGGLFQVAIKGGKATPLTEPDPKAGEVQHSSPHFLPGGEALLYTAINADQSKSTVYGISLRNPAARIALVKANSNAGVLTLPDGRSYLLYAKGRALVSHPFDPQRTSLSGEPFVLEPKASYYPFHSMADFSAASDVLVYRSTTVTQARKLIVVDRAGKTLLENASLGVYRFPRISPDGNNIAVERLALDSSSGNLWVAPLKNLVLTNRLTLDAAGSYAPVWSPDSQYIIYGTRRVEGAGLFRKSVRDGVERPVTGMQGTPTDYSRDGEWVLFNHEDSKTSRDIWLARADGSSPPVVFRRTRHDELDAQFSPDGKWVTYCSYESGVSEVYVERFPQSTTERARVQVSRGYSPFWTKAGNELVFHNNGSLFAVQRLHGDGVRFSEPKPLFSAAYFHGGFGYHVSADGEKFVFSVPSESQPASSSDIGVLLWK